MAGHSCMAYIGEVVWLHYGEVVYRKVLNFLSLSYVPGTVPSVTVTKARSFPQGADCTVIQTGSRTVAPK